MVVFRTPCQMMGVVLIRCPERVLDTLLTGFTSLLATMESATDLEQVSPAAQTCGRLPDIGPDSGSKGAGLPELSVSTLIRAANGERNGRNTSTISDDRHTPIQTGSPDAQEA